MGKVVKGTVEIVGGLAIGLFTGQWGLAFAVASAGVSTLLPPKLPSGDLGGRQGAILSNSLSTTDRLPVIYGTARVGGAFADIRVDNKSTDRKRLEVIVAFCHGSRDGEDITAIDQVWLDDQLAIDGTTVKAPFNGDVPNESGQKFLGYAYHLGHSTQTVDPRMNQLFPVEYPITSRGRGVAYARFELWYDKDTYPSGQVPTIQAKIRGNKVYDPRDSTWKFSTNPALCIRDYLCSSIYGFGIPEAYLDDSSFIDMANYCDELVAKPGGGTQKRYEMNGWVDTSRTTEENLAELCTSCRAQVVNEGQMWRLIIRRQRAVTGFQITEKNTVEGSWKFILPAADSVPNVGRATYVDPASNYDVNTVEWPEPGTPNAYLDDDNGYEQRMEIDLPFTQDRVMAQQLLMTLIKEGRLAVGATLTLKEEALQVRVGDLIEVTHSTPGWTKKVMDVMALLLQPNAQVQAVLIDYDDTVYDLDAQSPQLVPPDTNLPNPFTVAPPTSLVLTSTGQELTTNDGRKIPRIRATWGKSNDPFIDYYEVQAKKTSDTTWDSFGRVRGTDDAILYVVPVTDEQWDVQVFAVNAIGKRSDPVAGSVLVVTPDPRPQIISITMATSHVDVAHTDSHTDVSHADSGHVDTHADGAHTDHTDHSDAHSDSTTHGDVSHVDTHSDIGMIDTDHTDIHSDSPHTDTTGTHSDTHSDSNHQDTIHDDAHGDIGMIDTDHTDTHADDAHADHSDAVFSHTDVAHADSHTDTGHADSPHSDGHTDNAHSDGQYGIGVAIQADSDSASIRAVARKHGDHADASTHTDVTDPTVTELRTQPALDGRNVVIDLVDIATGAHITMDPGDRVRVAAVAYSAAGGGGTEGPLALASVGLFTVAPVGTNKWVPS